MDWTWIKTISIEDLAKIAKERIPYAFARYGDGEWISLLELRPANKGNCDQHKYFRDMGTAIRTTLVERPTYCLGIQRLATDVYGEKIHLFLDQHKLFDLDWVYSDVLHKSSIKGTFHTLARECTKAIWIGPAHLRPVAMALQCHTFIESKLPNAWDDYQVLLDRAKEVIRPGSLVLLSCGMPAKVLINALQKYQPAATILDLGAVWDPYAGVKSRKYMQVGDYSLPSLLRGCDG